MAGQPPQPPRAEVGYIVAGEGREVFTRFQIRDRIREGQISPATELAMQGSEDYRPASSFPELQRYFALATPGGGAASPTSVAAGEVWRPTAPAVVPASQIPSVATRLGPGLVYPFTGIGWIFILVVALFGVMNPIMNLIGGLFTAVYGLAVIRQSSEGSTRMPPLSAVGGPLTFIVSFLKVVVVSLISAWPVIVAVFLTMVLPCAAMLILAGAAIVMILYYPAALATLARYNSIKIALTPSQIFSFMNILGLDYVIALLSFFIVLAIGFVVSFGATMAVGAMKGSAEMLGFILGAFATWAGFYFYHLLGWGMHRHRAELG